MEKTSRYFEIMFGDENSDPNEVFCYKEYLGKIQNELHILTQGRKLDEKTEWDKAVTLKYNPEEKNILTDYLNNVIDWEIVSDKFVELTKHLIQEDVQYLPITILNEKTGEKITSYSVLNVTSFTDALDLESSDYHIMRARGIELIAVKKYALKAKELKNKHILRLKGSEVALFVSEEMKKIIEENNLTGFGFLEVAVY